MKIQTLFLVSIIGFFCNGAFADATALCKDGTEYTGKSKRGACRGHDGIKEWYGDKAASSDSDDDSKSKSKSKKGKAKEEKTAAEEASGPATGVCKDGYVTSGTNKRSACRGHDGIKEWYADKEKEAPAEKSAKSKSKSDDSKTSAAAGPTTGICKDGFETSGTNKRSACRGHDGIKEWYADKEKAAPAEKEPAAEKSAKGKSDEPAAPSGTATGLCKDGTEYTGASKRGACRGHKGLKEWYADTEEKEDEIAETEPVDTKAAPADAKKAAPVAKRPPKPAAGSGKVWVNTKSKIYHCEDSRFYGRTLQGEYMNEANAEKQGFRANRNKTCNQ